MSNILKILISLGVLSVLACSGINECDRLAGSLSDKSLNGVGVEFEKMDAKKAIEVCAIILKIEPTNVRNIYELGRAYDKNKDYAKAMEWYEKAAKQGYASAQFNLGFMYDKGQGVNQDDAKAMEWYEKAAKQGDDSAQFNLRIMYVKGQGVKQDCAKAVEWFEKAAKQGSEEAQGVLGVMYANGLGVKQDYAKAKKWLTRAAKQGSVNAQTDLGVMYANGLGVKQDYAKAKKWLKKAAKQGSKKAQESLGMIANALHSMANTFIESQKAKERERAKKEKERKSSIWYKKILNFFEPSEETIVVDLAYQYHIDYAQKSEIEIIKSYEKDGKTVQILFIKDMICEMPMLEVKGDWRSMGINCKRSKVFSH